MKNSKFVLTKSIALSISGLVLAASTASAVLTVDLRASASSSAAHASIVNGKTVALNTIGGGFAQTDISIQVWAQVTKTGAPTASYGIQSLLGSVVTNSSVPGATGITSFAPGGMATAFTQTNQLGVAAEFSSPVDTVTDRGEANGAVTAPTANHIKFRANPTTATGEVINGVSYVSTGLNGDTDPADQGVTFNLIPNGAEFLMGTIRLRLTANAGGTFTTNWVVPASFSGDSNLGQIAQWTEGDNLGRNPSSTSNGVVNVGGAITIASVPEPSAFGMVLIGALGLVGFRRLGFRRS